MRVIAVDDEKLSLMKIERMLKEIPGIDFVAGYKYAADVLENQGKDAADLAFLDVEMPGMDGLALCELLMEQNPNIEVIFVTAHEKYALQAYQTNAIGYLLKPIQFADIKAQVERLLRYQKPAGIGQGKPYFRVFGQFLIQGDRNSAHLFRFRTEKSEELLAFLLSRRGIPVPRDVLCDALWPDMDQDKATRNFHTTAYNIRRTFNEAGLTDLLQRVHESYLLNAQRYESDLDVFCGAAEQLDKGCARFDDLESGINAYDGTFMANKGYAWLVDYQSHYDRQFEKMALWLCDECMKSKNHKKAEAFAQKLLKHNPLSEEGCERLIRLCLENDKQAEAMKIFTDFRKKYLEEMGVEPSIKR